MIGNCNKKVYDRVRSYNKVVTFPESLREIEKFAFTPTDRFLINLTQAQDERFHEILSGSSMKFQVDDVMYERDYAHDDKWSWMGYTSQKSIYGTPIENEEIREKVEEIGL